MIMDAYSIMVLILIAHGFAMVQAGAVRGLGMLHTATYMVFIAFYLVSLPVAYLLAFTYEWGINGLWSGVVVGSVVEVVLYFIFLGFMCNWKLIAVEISDKMKLKQSPDVSFKKQDLLLEPLLKGSHSSDYKLRKTSTGEDL